MKNLLILSLITGLSFCQEIATTKDGKLIILHNNGTWENINSPTSETKLQKHTADVYVTKTGKKYHRDGCRYLKSRIPISLSDAVAKGYTGCLVCNLPSFSTAPSNTETYTPNTNYQSNGRCTAMTKKGTRCRRNAKHGNSYCWQHG